MPTLSRHERIAEAERLLKCLVDVRRALTKFKHDFRNGEVEYRRGIAYGVIMLLAADVDTMLDMWREEDDRKSGSD